MKPEVRVRQAAYGLGYRFRLHRRDLPGKPDLTFIGRKKVIFVHGCFWHQHPHCIDGRIPQSNLKYWRPKLARNITRDAEHLLVLRRAGWCALVVWECETKNHKRLDARLRRFLS